MQHICHNLQSGDPGEETAHGARRRRPGARGLARGAFRETHAPQVPAGRHAGPAAPVHRGLPGSERETHPQCVFEKAGGKRVKESFWRKMGTKWGSRDGPNGDQPTA